MSNEISRLLRNNREWSERMRGDDPEYFRRLVAQQSPEFLWIGCADSRVPANVVTGLIAGQLFVHRNVANVVVHTDLNCLSVIQYAVDVLRVRHILVVGHYGCGGVGAALAGGRLGLIDNWLRHVQDVRDAHGDILEAMDPRAQEDALCELNVIEQVMNVCETTIVGDAWARGHELGVHGWIYGLHDGLVRELGMSVSSRADRDATYQRALAGVRGRQRGQSPQNP
ncbi:MAG: carbonate dehydratase [Actinobacteria bacterium]|nr:carbonate dehydratase [Actinomycetota bacterium]